MDYSNLKIENSFLTKEFKMYIKPSINMPLRTDVIGLQAVAVNELGKVSFEEASSTQLTPKDTSITATTSSNLISTATSDSPVGRILISLPSSTTIHTITVTNSFASSSSSILLNSSAPLSTVVIKSKSFGSFTIEVRSISSFSGNFSIDFVVIN